MTHCNWTTRTFPGADERNRFLRGAVLIKRRITRNYADSSPGIGRL